MATTTVRREKFTIHQSIFDMMDTEPLPNDVQRKLVKLAQDGSKEAADLLVNTNLRFVYRIVQNYFPNSDATQSDMINLGASGILRAIESFDMESKNTFMSYAVHWIRQRIAEFRRDNCRTIRFPANKSKEADYSYIAFDTPITITGATIADFIPQSTFDSAEEVHVGNKKYEKLYEVINSFSYEEQVAIRGTYGLDGVIFTQKEMAARLKIQRNRMAWIVEKAKRRLIDALKHSNNVEIKEIFEHC